MMMMMMAGTFYRLLARGVPDRNISAGTLEQAADKIQIKIMMMFMTMKTGSIVNIQGLSERMIKVICTAGVFIFKKSEFAQVFFLQN